jgi:hypothetical protein
MIFESFEQCVTSNARAAQAISRTAETGEPPI